jgi:predicted HicB family RNase H-like nuclease
MTYRMKAARIMTDVEIEALTEEVVNADYDLDEVNARPGRPPRTGRPPMGSGPAVNVQVRLDPELRQALEAAAERDGTTVSDVIRRALRSHLAA